MDRQIDLPTIETNPTAEGQIVTQANNAVRTKCRCGCRTTPLVPPVEGAKPIPITLRLSAKDATEFARHLRDVIPVTRIASGRRYSHTYQAPDASAEFVPIQGWDSRRATTGLPGLAQRYRRHGALHRPAEQPLSWRSSTSSTPDLPPPFHPADRVHFLNLKETS
jgi:hypothetical protein